MIIFAIAGSVVALVWIAFVVSANGMRSSPGEFVGGDTLWLVGVVVVVLWLAWWFK